jgi:hypothetical protein
LTIKLKGDIAFSIGQIFDTSCEGFIMKAAKDQLSAIGSGINARIQPHRITVTNKFHYFYAKLVNSALEKMAQQIRAPSQLSDAELDYKLQDSKETTVALVKLSLALLGALFIGLLALRTIAIGSEFATKLSELAIILFGNTASLATVLNLPVTIALQVSALFCVASVAWFAKDVGKYAIQVKARGNPASLKSLLLDREVPRTCTDTPAPEPVAPALPATLDSVPEESPEETRDSPSSDASWEEAEPDAQATTAAAEAAILQRRNAIAPTNAP